MLEITILNLFNCIFTDIFFRCFTVQSNSATPFSYDFNFPLFSTAALFVYQQFPAVERKYPPILTLTLDVFYFHIVTKQWEQKRPFALTSPLCSLKMLLGQ